MKYQILLIPGILFLLSIHVNAAINGSEVSVQLNELEIVIRGLSGIINAIPDVLIPLSILGIIIVLLGPMGGYSIIKQLLFKWE